jgi:hypothetical protein
MGNSEELNTKVGLIREYAAKLAQLLGITGTGHYEVHCRDGKPKDVKVQKTLSLGDQR